ncbi:MAG: tetratricopeptide repeat protein [Bacteroidales bacterium]|nr:tetratricopeptide repeat protein [Bacteroidales bacterium]MCF8458053.1 tetratricopeptide repeat protein [Bacteroidales bacterium]
MYRSFFLILIVSFAVFGCNPGSGGKSENGNQDTVSDSTSIEFISRQINEGDKSPELFAKRAEMYILQNMPEMAIKDMEIALAIDSLNTAYYLTLAEYQMRVGRSGKAKGNLEKCVEIDPENQDATIKLAEIYLYVQQYKESMEWVLKAQKLNANNAHVYFVKSLIYKETGDTMRAIDNLFTVIEKDPESYEGYMLLGSLHAAKKDSLALPFFRNALNLKPNNVDAYYNMAMFYQNNNQPDKALKTYNDLLEKADPKYLFAFYNMGYIYMQQKKDYDKAIEYFTKSIELKSNYFQAYHNRGFAYEQKGEYALARQDYQKALDILPNYELSIAGLNRLDVKIAKGK